jgi:hypothetical protein
MTYFTEGGSRLLSLTDADRSLLSVQRPETPTRRKTTCVRIA